MGIKLMQNFDQPYSATSIDGFWRRWHISLSSWFRDYLYIPLGGSRTGLFRQCLIILFVFAVSGFWHGANWNFIIWGSLNGLYLIFSRLLKRLNFIKNSSISKLIGPTMGQLYSQLVVFNLASFAWIFFRANTFADAKWTVTQILFLFMYPASSSWHLPSSALHEIFIGVGLILLLLFGEWMSRNRVLWWGTWESSAVFRWSIQFLFLVALMGIILLSLTSQNGSQKFIYFQF